MSMTELKVEGKQTSFDRIVKHMKIIENNLDRTHGVVETIHADLERMKSAHNLRIDLAVLTDRNVKFGRIMNEYNLIIQPVEYIFDILNGVSRIDEDIRGEIQAMYNQNIRSSNIIWKRKLDDLNASGIVSEYALSPLDRIYDVLRDTDDIDENVQNSITTIWDDIKDYVRVRDGMIESITTNVLNCASVIHAYKERCQMDRMEACAVSEYRNMHDAFTTAINEYNGQDIPGEHPIVCTKSTRCMHRCVCNDEYIMRRCNDSESQLKPTFEREAMIIQLDIEQKFLDQVSVDLIAQYLY